MLFVKEQHEFWFETLQSFISLLKVLIMIKNESYIKTMIPKSTIGKICAKFSLLKK